MYITTVIWYVAFKYIYWQYGKKTWFIHNTWTTQYESTCNNCMLHLLYLKHDWNTEYNHMIEMDQDLHYLA